MKAKKIQDYTPPRNYKPPRFCGLCTYILSIGEIGKLPTPQEGCFCNVDGDVPKGPYESVRQRVEKVTRWKEKNYVEYFGTCDRFERSGR